jgi:hypothetical protein
VTQNVFLDFHQYVAATLGDLQADSAAGKIALARIEDQLTAIGEAMADNSALLNEVAEGLRGPLLTSVTDLIASEKAALARVAELEGRNAELEGEDAGESAAAQAVRSAFDGLAAKFADDPEAPDVQPLPEPEPAPVDPTPTPDEPAPVEPGDGGTDVVNPTVDENGNPIV